jgi:glutamine amidotransferase
VIVIVDYGMGNLRSVQKAFERIGCAAEVSDRPDAVAGAERLVVPGVGAFGDAMAALRQRQLVEPIRAFSLSGRPMLGICLGLQVFFDESEEVASGAACAAGVGDATGTEPGGQARRLSGARTTPSANPEKGLGLVRGRVVRFGPHGVAQGLKVPHMGWNRVELKDKNFKFWKGIPEGAAFYFVHSYYAESAGEAACAGETEYGKRFASVIARGNILATQFHPEKSQADGLRVLKNFIES